MSRSLVYSGYLRHVLGNVRMNLFDDLVLSAVTVPSSKSSPWRTWDENMISAKCCEEEIKATNTEK